MPHLGVKPGFTGREAAIQRDEAKGLSPPIRSAVET